MLAGTQEKGKGNTYAHSALPAPQPPFSTKVQVSPYASTFHSPDLPLPRPGLLRSFGCPVSCDPFPFLLKLFRGGFCCFPTKNPSGTSLFLSPPEWERIRERGRRAAPEELSRARPWQGGENETALTTESVEPFCVARRSEISTLPPALHPAPAWSERDTPHMGVAAQRACGWSQFCGSLAGPGPRAPGASWPARGSTAGPQTEPCAIRSLAPGIIWVKLNP